MECRECNGNGDVLVSHDRTRRCWVCRGTGVEPTPEPDTGEGEADEEAAVDYYAESMASYFFGY